jgi:hypothetical protein
MRKKSRVPSLERLFAIISKALNDLKGIFKKNSIRPPEGSIRQGGKPGRGNFPPGVSKGVGWKG